MNDAATGAHRGRRRLRLAAKAPVSGRRVEHRVVKQRRRKHDRRSPPALASRCASTSVSPSAELNTVGSRSRSATAHMLDRLERRGNRQTRRLVGATPLDRRQAGEIELVRPLELRMRAVPSSTALACVQSRKPAPQTPTPAIASGLIDRVRTPGCNCCRRSRTNCSSRGASACSATRARSCCAAPDRRARS